MQDPRFLAAIAQINAGDYAEAADALEELFFEAVRDEVEPVRALMQIATGMHHIERGQARAAIERLEEGIAAIDRITNAHGLDVAALRVATARAVEQLRARQRVTRVRVVTGK
jgi:predicted metal-dependent hydrolase